jgi:transcription antitermination factor NusA-like protein
MQTPICVFCAKTNTLCGNCDKKIKEGTLSQFDVDLSKYLYDKFGELDLEYVSSFLAKDMVVLFFRGNIGPIVGKAGRGALEIGRTLGNGKRVKIINLKNDIKKIISDIIYPVTLVGINSVFSGDGEVSKIRFLRRDMARIPFEINSMEKILSKLLNKRIAIVFE